jgi:hypothetical protein
MPANINFSSEANIACLTSEQHSNSKGGYIRMKKLTAVLMSLLALLLAAGANWTLI